MAGQALKIHLVRFRGRMYHLLRHLLSALFFSFRNFNKSNCFSTSISSNSRMIHSLSLAIVCSSPNSKQRRRNSTQENRKTEQCRQKCRSRNVNYGISYVWSDVKVQIGQKSPSVPLFVSVAWGHTFRKGSELSHPWAVFVFSSLMCLVWPCFCLPLIVWFGLGVSCLLLSFALVFKLLSVHCSLSGLLSPYLCILPVCSMNLPSCGFIAYYIWLCALIFIFFVHLIHCVTLVLIY